MAAPQPKTIADKLFEDLAILRNGKRDEFSIKRLHHEADKLINIDRAAAFSIKGALACLAGDLSDMHKFHRQAISYSNDLGEDYTNYAASLAECEEYKEAFEYTEKALLEKPDYALAIKVMVITLHGLGKCDEASNYVKKFEKLTGVPFPEAFFREDIDSELDKMLTSMDENLANGQYVEADEDDFFSMLELVDGVE